MPIDMPLPVYVRVADKSGISLIPVDRDALVEENQLRLQRQRPRTTLRLDEV